MTTEGETPAADPADELVPLASVDRMLDDAELLLANIVYDRHTPLSDNHSLAVQVAKALAAVAAGRQFQQQLVLARESRRVQDQQLELQRQVGFPGLAGCVELASQIASVEDGHWDARMVNYWIAQARALDTP